MRDRRLGECMDIICSSDDFLSFWKIKWGFEDWDEDLERWIFLEYIGHWASVGLGWDEAFLGALGSLHLEKRASEA